MRHHAAVLVALAVTGVVLAGTPASASAKCFPSVDIPRLAEVLYIIDDEVAGEERFRALDRDDILSVYIGCREVTHPETGGPARQQALMVVTFSGAQALMEAQLRDLVEAQHAHYAAHGRYGETLEALDFLETRSRLGIRMSVSETGWAADVNMGGTGTECHVAVGSAEVQHPDQVEGVPSCRRIVEPESPGQGPAGRSTP